MNPLRFLALVYAGLFVLVASLNLPHIAIAGFVLARRWAPGADARRPAGARH